MDVPSDELEHHLLRFERSLVAMTISRPWLPPEDRGSVLSCFVLELGGTWVLMAVDRVLDVFEQALTIHPDARFSLHPVAGESEQAIPFDLGPESYISASNMGMQRLGSGGLSPKDIENASHMLNLDGAFIVLPPAIRANLEDRGVISVRKTDLFAPKNADLPTKNRDLRAENGDLPAYWVGGFPSSLAQRDEGGDIVGCPARWFPIAPKSLDPPLMDFVPLVEDEDPSEGAAGMAGGLVTVHSEGQTRWLGLQTGPFFHDDGTMSITVASGRFLIDLFRGG